MGRERDGAQSCSQGLGRGLLGTRPEATLRAAAAAAAAAQFQLQLRFELHKGGEMRQPKESCNQNAV